MQFQTAGSLEPSPDGKLVAWTQTRNVMESEKSEALTHIFLARADGSGRVQLTQGEKSCTAPAFSPDSRYVYFTSDRSGKTNVWRIAVSGGEAEMITDWKGSLGSYKLSPDGKWIAFSAAEERADEEKAKKEKRDWRVVDENPLNHGLWLIPVTPDAGGKREAKKLAAPVRHVVSFDWSPDSRFLAFSHVPAPDADVWPKSDISEVEVESGNVKVLAGAGAAESDPHYSLDGRWIAFTRTSDPARWPSESRIAVLPRQGGEARLLAPTADEAPAIIGWSSDSSRIYYAEGKRTRRGIYSVPLDGPTATVYEPARGVVGPSASVNGKGTALGFAASSPEEAPEAYLLGVSGGSPVRVSAANTSMPKLPLGETKLIRWKAQDGLEIEGLLTYPAGYEAGRKYPLILNIHGGPTGVFSESFIGGGALYPIAVFAARGYAVLRVNPRGSGGYGRTFRFANLGDWGGKDYEDIMAGVDHVIALGVADPERLAVMGWSYGGFMTSWVVTHTRRFKAAVVGAGVTNLWSFTGTSDIVSFLPDYFSGEPWDRFQAYREHSPMSFVKGVTTPTLILHGEADVRVPTSQGYEFYNALKRQGVTVKMVVYPRTPHGPREPKFILDIMQRHIDWVEKYVR